MQTAVDAPMRTCCCRKSCCVIGGDFCILGTVVLKDQSYNGDMTTVFTNLFQDLEYAALERSFPLRGAGWVKAKSAQLHVDVPARLNLHTRIGCWMRAAKVNRCTLLSIPTPNTQADGNLAPESSTGFLPVGVPAAPQVY